jgi:hypothetical protein
MPYAEIFEQFPPELRLPIARLVDALKEELGVQRTDFAELRAIVRELAEAQQRTELRVEEFARAPTLFRYTFDSQIGDLGARWGMQTEEAFQQGMRAILQEVGFTAERFLEYDAAGAVFGHPEQVELDVVVKDGKVIVIEIIQ